MSDGAADVPSTYEEFANNHDSPRFSEWLRQRSEPVWSHVTTHQFVKELGSDTIADSVFARWTEQDIARHHDWVSLVGYAIGQAPTMEAKEELTFFLNDVMSDDQDYYGRTAEALGTRKVTRVDCPPVAAQYIDLLLRSIQEGGYEETMAVLLAIEWAYFEAANTISDQSPSRFYLDEWIEVHADPEFESVVTWLRGELDTYGPTLTGERQQCLDDLFTRAVGLEKEYFDVAYEYADDE